MAIHYMFLNFYIILIIEEYHDVYNFYGFKWEIWLFNWYKNMVKSIKYKSIK
jgi:hypothetical protein